MVPPRKPPTSINGTAGTFVQNVHNFIMVAGSWIFEPKAQSATTGRAGGMRMAPGKGPGHLCWGPLIYINS